MLFPKVPSLSMPFCITDAPYAGDQDLEPADVLEEAFVETVIEVLSDDGAVASAKVKHKIQGVPKKSGHF